MRIIIDNIRELKLKETLLWLGTITLVTILLWIGYTVYSSYRKPTVDNSIQALRKPLNPSIDLVTLDSLEDRIVLPETFAVTKIATGEEEVIEAPVEAPASTPSATPVASESGELIPDQVLFP